MNLLERIKELDKEFDKLVDIEKERAAKAFIARRGECPKVRRNAPDWCWDKANEEYLKWEIDYDYEMHQARMAVWDTPLGEELLRLRSLWEKRGVPEKVEQYQEGIVERTVFSDGSMTERWDKESDKENFNYFYR